MVDRTGLCLIDRFIRIGSVVSILLGKSNEFIASKIYGKLLFLVLSSFFPLKLIVIFKNQAWMYLESNGRKTRPIERRSIPLADRKESFRIIFSTISIEKITRKHFYHIFSKFIHTKVVYFLFFIYVRELFVKYNFVKLFLTKSIENYLTNTDKLFLIFPEKLLFDSSSQLFLTILARSIEFRILFPFFLLLPKIWPKG